ncbi:MAG: peptide deformylase [Limnochordales bacterium]|nr:peptide deformylase [Bacillota bacterium]
MAVLPIVKVPAEVLRRKAKPVKRVTKRVQKLIEDMVETMYHANGVGLAAPQVGVSEQIIVADDGNGLLCLINPRITYRAGHEVDVEGCLSIPDIVAYVARATEIEVEGLDERGRPVRHRLEGYLARIVQHEVDHLNGVLITDIAESVHRADELEREERRAQQSTGAAEPAGEPVGAAGEPEAEKG